MYIDVGYSYIQDGGMHAAFDKNMSIYFENQAIYGIIVKEIYISDKLNLYCHIPLIHTTFTVRDFIMHE
jgi:hypothetical protein